MKFIRDLSYKNRLFVYRRPDPQTGDGVGADDPGRESADGHALTVLLQDREHQDTVTGIANDVRQSEYRADRHRQAGCGNRGKVIWRIKNGFDHCVPHYTYNEPRREAGLIFQTRANFQAGYVVGTAMPS